MLDPTLSEQLRGIRLLAMDVDGVLTDGGIHLGALASGDFLELKTFSARDGLGISLARSAGMEVAWITGRISQVVERRAAELGVREVCQWARNKHQALTEIRQRLDIERSDVLYIGDDLNDLPAFEAAGVTVAVADAAGTVRERADWVTDAPGGAGAVREVVEVVLHAQARWDAAVHAFLERLEGEHGRPPAQ